MSDDDEPAYQRYERTCIARGRCVCGKDLSLQGRHLLGCTRSSQYRSVQKRPRDVVVETVGEVVDLAVIRRLTPYTPSPHPSIPWTFNGVTISHADPIVNGIMCLTHSDLPLRMIFLRPQTLLVCTRGVGMYVAGVPWHAPIPSVSTLCAVGPSNIVLLGGLCMIAMVSVASDTNTPHVIATYRFADATDEVSAVAAASQRRVMVALRRPTSGVYILSWDDSLATFVPTRHLAVTCTISSLFYLKDNTDSLMIATEHSGCALVSLASMTPMHSTRWLPDLKTQNSLKTVNTRFYLLGEDSAASCCSENGEVHHFWKTSQVVGSRDPPQREPQRAPERDRSSIWPVLTSVCRAAAGTVTGEVLEMVSGGDDQHRVMWRFTMPAARTIELEDGGRRFSRHSLPEDLSMAVTAVCCCGEEEIAVALACGFVIML